MPTKKWLQENKEHMRSYYREYNRTHRFRLEANRKRIKDWLCDYKSNLKCEQCSESCSACLDFHHKDPSQKEFGICLGAARAYSIERLKIEIAKCSVLCSNCHKREHPYQNKKVVGTNRRKEYQKRLRVWMDGYKVSCEICGENYQDCLEFHHIDEDKKEFNMATAHCREGKGAIINEIAKCQVLCSNCHRKLHWERMAKTKELK